MPDITFIKEEIKRLKENGGSFVFVNENKHRIRVTGTPSGEVEAYNEYLEEYINEKEII